MSRPHTALDSRALDKKFRDNEREVKNIYMTPDELARACRVFIRTYKLNKSIVGGTESMRAAIALVWRAGRRYEQTHGKRRHSGT